MKSFNLDFTYNEDGLDVFDQTQIDVDDTQSLEDVLFDVFMVWGEFCTENHFPNPVVCGVEEVPYDG